LVIEEQAPVHMRVQAQGKETAVDLLLALTLPVLQSDDVYSVKGPEPGNASLDYYSLVQQPTVGAVTIQGKDYPVSGKS
jgi:predicted secreted hydrolase